MILALFVSNVFLGAILIVSLRFILWSLRDPDYETWNKRAFQLVYKCLNDNWSVGFLDLDNLHVCNSEYGYEVVNEKIRKSLQMRTGSVSRTDMLFRYFSGDEIVFVARKDDAEGMANRISGNMVENGLSCTMAVGKISQLEAVKAKVQYLKSTDQRGVVVFLDKNI